MENIIDSLPINNEIANPFLGKPQEILQNTGIQAFQKKENRIDIPDYFGMAASEVQKPFFKETSVNIADKYDVVFDKLRPKYESYTPGIDNAEHWAQRQSWGDKLANGITKMGLKAASNVVGGTLGFVNGLAVGIKEGQFHAFSHNSFSEFLDETNKLLDNQLPNRLTKEYQNRNFLQKLTKVDFWAGEVGDAFAFMAGTIGSELIWGAATGGASWALSAAKWAARGAKGAASVAGKLGAKGVEMGIRNATAVATKTTLKGYARNVNTASKAAGIANNIRFVLTSTGFEAGVEARGSFDENIQEFQNLKMQQENRMPTFEEYQKFIPEAISASNAVFRTNIAILSVSNAAQFGKMLGLKKVFDLNNKLAKTLGLKKVFDLSDKTVNKYVMGKGVSKLQDGTYALYKSNAAQRITGKTFDWFKNPIVEGAEEGFQGVANRYFGGRLMSKYDPESTHLNMTMMESLGDSLYESFLTKEGFNEVGIGMLIGKLGGVFRGGGVKGAIKNVVSEIMPGTEYKADIKALEESVQSVNEAIVGMDKATRDSIVNFSLLNQQIRATADANRALELGDAGTAKRGFHAAAFYKMQADNRMGMLEEGYEDFKKQLELMDSTEFAEDFGIPEQDVTDYKQRLLERYEQEKKEYELSEQYSKNLDPHSTLKGLKKEHFQEEIAFNFFMGLQSLQDIDAIGRTLEKELGSKGLADQIAYFNALTEKEQELSGELTKINRNVKNLETRYANLQMEYSTLLEQSKRVEENITLVRKIENNRKRAAEVLEEKNRAEEQQEKVKQEFEKSPKERGFVFGSLFDSENKIESPQTIIESVEALEKLDSYLETLRNENPEKATVVESLIDEYKKTVLSLQELNKTLKTVADPRYRTDAFKGVGKALNRYYGRKAKEKDTDEFRKAIDSLVEKTEGIDEYEAAFIHSINDLIDSVVDYDTMPEGVRETIDIEETVERDEFKDFLETGNVKEETLNEIIDRKENEIPLTRRQSRIAEQKTKEIESALEKIKKERGDSLKKAKRKAEKVEPIKSESNIEVIRQLIQDILDRKKSYINKGATEIGKEVPKVVNDYDKSKIPTEEEYRRYNKLKKDAEKKPLSKLRQSEFDALQEKINSWGSVEGTVSGKYSLLDLYTQLFELEEKAKKDKVEQVSEGEHAVEPSIEEEEEISPTTNIPYNILQTYDKVFYSVEDGKTAISNLSVRGIIEHLGKYLNITSVKVNGKPTDLEKINKNKDNLITIEHEGGEISFTLSQYRGRLVFDEENKGKLLEDGKLRIGHNYKGKPMTAYQVVMHEVQGESIPLQSSLEGDLGKVNVAEVQATQVGTEVRAVVDLQDPYNKALLEEYNKREKTKNPMSIEEFRDKLKIEYMNGEVFIGYLKQNHPSQSETAIQKEAISTRDEAARLVLENQSLKTVETGIAHKVSKVFLSQPHLNIVDGQVRMSEVKEEHKDKIDTIGYIEGGTVTLQKGDTKGVVMSFVNRIIKDKNKRYTGKRVPIVILNFAGKRVAYPVEMIENTNENAPQEFDDILNRDSLQIDKVVEIYRLLSENGIDPSTTQLRTDNFNDAILRDIRQRLVDNVQHASIKELTESKTPAAQIASENMLISIDLSGNMFHSPKVVLDYGKVAEESKPAEEITEEDLEGETAAAETKNDAELKALEKQNNSLQSEESILPLQTDMGNTNTEAGSDSVGDVGNFTADISDAKNNIEDKVASIDANMKKFGLTSDASKLLIKRAIEKVDGLSVNNVFDLAQKIAKNDNKPILIEHIAEAIQYEVGRAESEKDAFNISLEDVKETMLAQNKQYYPANKERMEGIGITEKSYTERKNKLKKIKEQYESLPETSKSFVKSFISKFYYTISEDVKLSPDEYLQLLDGVVKGKEIEDITENVSNAIRIIEDKEAIQLRELPKVENPLSNRDNTEEALKRLTSNELKEIPVFSKAKVEQMIADRLKKNKEVRLNTRFAELYDLPDKVKAVVLNKDNTISFLDKNDKSIKGISLSKSEFVDLALKIGNAQYKSSYEISRLYHEAKADGNNPELVKAVEDLLRKETTKAETKVDDSVGGEELGQKSRTSVQPKKPTEAPQVGDDVVVTTPSREVVSGKIESIKYREDNGAIEYIVVEKEDGTPVEIYNRGGKDGEYMPSGVKIVGKNTSITEENKLPLQTDEVLTELGINKQNITTSSEVVSKAKEELNKDCK